MVWRYMDLLSLLAVLHNEELHFTSLRDLQDFDTHEGTGGLSIEIVRVPLRPSLSVWPENEEVEQRNREEIEKLTAELSRSLAERLAEIKARVAKWDEDNQNVSTAQSLVSALSAGGISSTKIGWGA